MHFILRRRNYQILAFVVLFFLLLQFLSNIHHHETIDSSDADQATELKVDWHDYKQIAEDKQRTGPGEHGRPIVDVKSPDEKHYHDLYNENGFNAAGSDQISLERSIPDIRHPQCWKMKYNKVLPTVSVVIPFYEEHWTTLLRSLISITRRAPKDLIKEVILVDDASTKEFLKDKLDIYARQYHGKVRVIRLKEHSGLITARLAGAREATGDVLIFLDSHIEANVNWLPPLLDPIAENYRTVVCPFIDVIDMKTFQYRPQDEGARGAFNWFLLYKRLPRLEEDRYHPVEPFQSPVMAGGLFAISRRWFWELGGYDPGLQIWGGEQYEISFKIWMCGGKMVDAPCSRIGHVYRQFNPFGSANAVMRNHKRVAEVWMDEYKQYIYDRNPQFLSTEEGDLTAQREIRNRLNCKSFDWFMKNIAFDLTNHYPLNMPGNGAEGQVWNGEGSGRLCLTRKVVQDKEILSVSYCHDNSEKFVFDWRGAIRPFSQPEICLDAAVQEDRSFNFLRCHKRGGNQKWKLSIRNKQITHDGRCLEVSLDQKEVFLNPCSTENVHQMWHWSKVSEINISEAHRQTI